MSQYIKVCELTDEEREDLRNLHRSIFQKCVRETKVSARWRLRRLNFDNTFGYGTNNTINFDRLSGITGIFGKNRSGKSSIPGTIVYGLFNSTDRGSLKNLHVINDRKTYCRSTIDFSIGPKLYRADRQTIKKTSRKGTISAPTSLNLFEVDINSGDEIIDKSEEQRRETEKVLRDLVGTLEDFMLTSFASQGEMNAFIKEGATKRKSILTRFLDLNIFEEMLRLTKEEVSELKGEMKSAPDRDWNAVIIDYQNSLSDLIVEREEVEQELAELQRKRDKVRLQLATDSENKGYTIKEINSQKEALALVQQEKKGSAKKIIAVCGQIEEINQKVEKVESIQDQFPVEEIKQMAKDQIDLEGGLDVIQGRVTLEKEKLSTLKKTAKKLECVPCGDKFPKCPYIKDAHDSFKKIPTQNDALRTTRTELAATKKKLKKYQNADAINKLERYQEIIQQAQDLKMERSNLRLELRELETNDEALKREVNDLVSSLRDMKLHSLDPVKDVEIVKMRNELIALEKRINSLDGERLYHAEQISVIKKKIEDLTEEKEKFGDLRKRWKTYNLLTAAVDRHGIPSEIIALQLPLINLELQNILQGVVNFDLKLEITADGSIEVMLDYGDSSRIVECGSGMEKMIASLALRVALINVCTLPRSDMLIIDEGFGALDDKNVEACSRLLLSLKKYFSNIIIISHVDAVKDVVDNVIDIQKNGKDAKVICA